MLRVPLTRAVCLAQSQRAGVLLTSTRMQSKAPEKIEVFIDDQPVMVLPGTTVLQVIFLLFYSLIIILKRYSVRFRLLHKLVLKFLDFVIMNDWQSLEIVECV